MRVVFELASDLGGIVYVVDVLKIDGETLTAIRNGEPCAFPVTDICNATTVTGRPFSLRPYDASTLPAASASS